MRATILAAAFIVASPLAHAHDWYDNQCCNEGDCRQTQQGEVERWPAGWYVVPLKTLVPYQDPRLRRSLDPLIHICLMHNGQRLGVRCLYVPEVSG